MEVEMGLFKVPCFEMAFFQTGVFKVRTTAAFDCGGREPTEGVERETGWFH